MVQLDTSELNKIIQEKKLRKDLIEGLKEYMDLVSSKRLYLSKMKDGTQG